MLLNILYGIDATITNNSWLAKLVKVQGIFPEARKRILLEN